MKRFLKYILIFIAASMLVFALLAGYIAYYVANNRDALKNMLVNQANGLTVGKWSVDSLSIDVWHSYPYVVVNLHNLKLYSDSLAMADDKYIFVTQKAGFRADVFTLMRKKLDISHVGLSDININLKRDENGDVNLVQALKLRDTIDVKEKMLSFNINQIDLRHMMINLHKGEFEVITPLKIDRFVAGVSHSDGTLNLSDCSVECYGLEFFLDLKFNMAKHIVAVDFSSSNRLLKFNGEVSFNKNSIITVKSKVESVVALAEYSGGVMSGDLFVKGIVDFDFDTFSYRMLDDRCKLKFGVNEVALNHKIDYMPQIVFHSGIVEYEKSTLVGNQIIMSVGVNNMELNFITSSISDILNKRKNYDLNFSANIKSSDFNPYIIKERLGLTADSLSVENSIKDLSVSFHTNLSPENSPLSLASGIGKFCVDIDNYTASISDSLTLSNFTGLLNVEGSTISLNNFKGNLGKSQATLNTQITIKNRENSEVFEKVNIAADFTTSHVSLKELNVAGLAVVLDDVRSKFSVEIIPDASHETERLESYIVNFDSFSALIGGKPFSQNSVIEKHGNMLKIIKSQLEYDSQTARITGSLYLGDKGKRDTLNIVTDNLDFKAFAGTNNAGRITLPIAKVPIVVDLTLGKFQLLNQDLTNLRGIISIESNKTLLFKNIRCGVAGGNVNFSGEFTQNLNNYEIKSDITYSNIDLKDLEIKYKISKKDKERYINENLRGKISGTAKANIFADGDRNIDVARSVINANFTIINGQLVDFAPIKAASKYFKRNDLNDIRFDTLSNQITVKSGVISIPRMNIASTLGNYFVSGTTSITDGNMDFMLEVPWNVIGGVVASRIFGGKPKDDDVIESEIKKRYVKFNITGTPETFDVKLRNK